MFLTELEALNAIYSLLYTLVDQMTNSVVPVLADLLHWVTVLLYVGVLYMLIRLVIRRRGA